MEDVALAASGAGQLVLAEALRSANGDDRAALALLQAAYLELSIRLAIEEQSAERQLPAVAAFNWMQRIIKGRIARGDALGREVLAHLKAARS